MVKKPRQTVPSLGSPEEDEMEEEDDPVEVVERDASGDNRSDSEIEGEKIGLLQGLIRRIRVKLYFVLWRYRRYLVPFPDLHEIHHYVKCLSCRQRIEAEGWRVGFKRDGKGELYKVTFMRESELRMLQRARKLRGKAGFYV